MSKYVSRGLALVLFTGGLTLLGAGIANAADTTGDDGLLSGTQIVAPITAPVEVAGNAISVLGDSLSGGAAAPAPAPAPAPVPAPAPAAPVSTTGSDSVLGGTQAVVEATVPVTVQGNAISVLGDSAATAAPAAAAPAAAPAAPAAAPTTSGSDGILGGTQVLPTVSVPVNLGGNAISVLGDSSSEGASAPAASAPASSAPASSGATTTGGDSVAGGTQIVPNVTVPVNLGGNAISVLGDSSSDGSTTTTAGPSGTAGSGATTSGSDGIAGGTQVLPTVSVPVNLGGNAISVLGDSSSEGSTTTTAGPSGTAGSGATTSGSDGIAGGTQVLPTVSVPVNLGGNAISVLGDSSSEGSTTTTAGPSGTAGSGATTSGSDGIAGGTQVAPDIALPVTVGGNAISILGDAASTGSSTSTETEGTSDDVTTSGNGGVLGGTQIIPSIALPITIGGNAISVLGDTEVDGTTPTVVIPTVPTGPVTPTDPTDPTGPVIPTLPTDTEVTVTTGTTVSAFGSGTTATAALSVQALASTGAEIGPMVALVAVLLVAGIALLIARRKVL